MEGNDAEDNLSQAHEYRNSMRRELIFDWTPDPHQEEEEMAGGLPAGRGSLSGGRGALGRGGEGRDPPPAAPPPVGRGRGSSSGSLGALGRGAEGRGPPPAAPPPVGRNRAKRTASVSSTSQGTVRSARGRGRGGAYKLPRCSTSVDLNLESQPTDGFDDNLLDATQYSSMQQVCDKAEWNFDNTRVFCELCIQEIDTGNRTNDIMSNRGYKNIAEKFKIATGLCHSKVQLKNKMDLLKGLYSFWLQMNKDTGLGWDEALGTVVASDEYWNKATKGHPHWKQLKRGPPEHEKLMQQMFGGIVVDGSSACAPDEAFERNEEEGLAAELEEEDEAINNFRDQIANALFASRM